MPLGYEVFAGGHRPKVGPADVTTVEHVVETMETRYGKSDLSIRPIWHQKEDRVLAHILVCFLAYVLWKTLGQLCERAGLGHEPRRVLSELSELRSIDVILPTSAGTEIRKRCITRPSEHQKILLTRLGLQLPAHLKTFEFEM